MPGTPRAVNWINDSGTGKLITELVACSLQSLGLKLGGKDSDILLSVRSLILIPSVFLFSNQ